MVISHIWALVAALSLGAETPVADLSPKPASIARVAAASNGREFLVAREETGGIYVTRVGLDGVISDSRGRFIAPGKFPKIASTGNGYLLAYYGTPGMQLQRLNDEGVPFGEPRLFPGAQPTALLSNGSTYLFVFFDVTTTSTVIFDSDGNPQHIVVHNFGGAGLGVHDSKYVAVQSSTLYTISDDGTFTTTALPLSVTPLSTPVAFAPSAILFPWTGAGTGYTVVGYDGTIIRLPNQLPVGAGEKLIATEWDGHQFLAVFDQGEAFRIASDGTLIDSAGVPITTRFINSFTFASSGTAVLTAWPRAFGLIASTALRVERDFDALASPAAATALATVPAEQVNAQIAQGPRGNFAVWTDSSGYEIRAAFNGTPILVDRTTGNRSTPSPGQNIVGAPSVAAGRVFLVTWWHSNDNNASVYARRYDFDGHPLDAQPVVVYSYPANGFVGIGAPPAIAFDGTSFVVVWNYYPAQFAAARVSDSGGVTGMRIVAPPLPFSEQNIYSHAARALWTGSEVLIPYTFDTQPQPPFQPQRFLAVARLGTENSISSTPALTTFNADTAMVSSRVGATITGGRVTYAWTDAAKNIQLAQTSLDGAIVRVPRVIVPRAKTDNATDAEIVWNGAEYVVAWRDGGAIRAVRLDAELHLIDPSPFDVANDAAPSEVSMVVTSSGVTIAYSRIDAGTARLFTRTIDRSGVETRRRAIGR